MSDTLLFGTALGVMLLIAFALLRYADRSRSDKSTPARRNPAASDPAVLARLRSEAVALDLRGSVFATTADQTIPGLSLTPLGPVSLMRDTGHDATGALARAAVWRYPKTSVLIGIRQKPKQGRVEWQATACSAQPDDPDMLPPPLDEAEFALVDGSNVVAWEKNAGVAAKADLTILIGVLDILRDEGLGAFVVFDANIGHRLDGKYLDEGHLHDALGGRDDVRVDVVPKGTIADQHLIALALQSGAQIVTNDLFRDHSNAHFLTKRRGFSLNGQVELVPFRQADDGLSPLSS